MGTGLSTSHNTEDEMLGSSVYNINSACIV